MKRPAAVSKSQQQEASNNPGADVSGSIRSVDVGPGERHVGQSSPAKLTLLVVGATILGLVSRRHIKSPGWLVGRGGRATQDGSGRPLFYGLLAIASGSALGSLFSQRPTGSQVQAEGGQGEYDHPDAAKQHLVDGSRGETGYATPADADEGFAERSIAVAALKRNVPNQDTAGSDLVNAPGPESQNAVYRGTENADS